jgi:hypothetical protein
MRFSSEKKRGIPPFSQYFKTCFFLQRIGFCRQQTMNAYPAKTWRFNEGGMSISASYSHQVHFSSHEAKLLNLNVRWNLLETGNVKYTKRSRTHLTWMTLFSCLKSHSHSACSRRVCGTLWKKRCQTCSVMGVAWAALHESDMDIDLMMASYKVANCFSQVFLELFV